MLFGHQRVDNGPIFLKNYAGLALNPMIDNARLEVDYITRKRSVTDRRQTDIGVHRAARSQLKIGSEIITPKKEIYAPEKWMLGSDILELEMFG